MSRLFVQHKRDLLHSSKQTQQWKNKLLFSTVWKKSCSTYEKSDILHINWCRISSINIHQQYPKAWEWGSHFWRSLQFPSTICKYIVQLSVTLRVPRSPKPCKPNSPLELLMKITPYYFTLVFAEKPFKKIHP